MGQDSIGQDQLYQDLSTCIFHIRNRLSALNQMAPSQLPSSQTSSVGNGIEQLIQKYLHATIAAPRHIKIIERFQLRVKDLVRGLLPPGTHKLALVVTVKKLEMLAIAPMTPHNCHLLIPNILRALTGSHQRSTSLIVSQPAAKRQQNQQKWAQIKNIVKQQESRQPGIIDKSQVQNVMRNIDKYNILGIDQRHLRGQYFDLRDKRKDCFAETMGRNKNIRFIMRSYDRDYQNYISKQGKQQKIILSVSNKQKDTIVRENTPERPFSLGLMAPKKYFSSSLMTAERHQPQEKKESSDHTRTISYRTAQESRPKDRKSKALRVRNYMMDLPFNPQSNVVGEFNFKKAHFYKKTQEQLKYRYKFGHRENNNQSALATTAFKCQTISREGVL